MAQRQRRTLTTVAKRVDDRTRLPNNICLISQQQRLLVFRGFVLGIPVGPGYPIQL